MLRVVLTFLVILAVLAAPFACCCFAARHVAPTVEKPACCCHAKGTDRPVQQPRECPCKDKQQKATISPASIGFAAPVQLLAGSQPMVLVTDLVTATQAVRLLPACLPLPDLITAQERVCALCALLL